MKTTTLKAIAISTALLTAPAALWAQSDTHKMEHKAEAAAQETSNEVSDAWVQTKLEAAFAADDQLSAWDIDTEVQGDTAYLNGEVETEAVKSLAEETAKNIDGIANVDNKLTVKAGNAS